jgi:hypothetical protein
MATTYTWDINILDALPYFEDKENVVVRVTWKLTADDGVNSTSLSNFTEIEYHPAKPFTLYEDLTKEQVLGWVNDLMSEEESARWKRTLDAHLVTLANKPEEVPPTPWA